MRILQISSAESFGGGERHLLDLVRGLTSRGHTVDVCVRPSCGWRQRLSDSGANKIFDLPLKGAADIRSAVRIGRLASRSGSEIIHAHLARDYPAACLGSRSYKNARAVLTRHVLFPLSFATRLLSSNAARIIAVSSGVETQLLKQFPARMITAIPNGIEAPSIDPEARQELRAEFRREFGIPKDAPLVTTIGELKPLKGQEDFVLMAAEVSKTNPSAQFLAVGTDNSRGRTFRRKLRRLVGVLDLETRFHFLDWVEDTAVLLAASDCLVSPSHSESFGLAMLEAMAVGTPVAATETAGARQLLDSGRVGKLVPPGDAVALAGAVGELIGDAAAAGVIAEAAKRRAVEEFSLDTMVRATEALYREVSTSDRDSEL